MNLALTELIEQRYTGNGCRFSAGTVEGHPVDTVYLKLEKDGEEPTVLLLRPDELLALVWCATGVLWSGEMQRLDEKEESWIMKFFKTARRLWATRTRLR